MLWAIERRVDGVELVEPDQPAPATAPNPVAQVVVTGARRYVGLATPMLGTLAHRYEATRRSDPLELII